MSSRKPSLAPRALDHLVLPVGALEMARARLGVLGFTVAPDARHPFGTENACVFFADGTYLEPLAVASRETCEASAKAGNAFIARDRVFRFRCGADGFSAIALKTADAGADHRRFCEAGLSGGDLLEFSRPVKTPEGDEAVASFRLAFAADLRAPDFFLFCCERVSALTIDRAVLENHANGVTGIARVVLCEENPSDFQELLEEAFGQREVQAHSFGLDLAAGTATLSVLTPAGAEAWFDLSGRDERGLRGIAVVFKVANLAQTEDLLRRNDIAYQHRHHRVLVPAAPGQGVLFAFEE